MVLATTAGALWVAALVAREPPDFTELPVIAVMRDAAQHAVWSVRLAKSADQIAVDSILPPAPPAGKNYQLWLVAPGLATPQPLGLLPLSGRKIFAEAPSNIRRLGGGGELWVTLEPASGTLAGAPGGPPVYRARFAAARQSAPE